MPSQSLKSGNHSVMMFEKFLSKNKADEILSFTDDEPVDQIKNLLKSQFPSINILLSQLGGKSFENGLYRVHTFGTGNAWTNVINNFFEDYENKIFCFAYDWLGCMYCADNAKKSKIYMFDPADLEVHVLEQTIESFHETDLTIYRDATLSKDRFKQVLKILHLPGIETEKCLGYKQSLFLNGDDANDNFDVWDLDAYWNMQYQIYQKIQDLPEGAEVGNIKFE